MIQPKLNINLTFFLILFLTLLSIKNYAQTEKELTYNKQKLQLKFQEQKLDSLNNVLKEKVKTINLEKSKASTDRNKIQELLSGTSNLTNLIENTQLKIDELNKQFTFVKSELVLYYGKQIDSIKNSKLTKDEKNKRTIQLTEKKLLVSPKIDLLSFEPESVLQINIPTDPIKRKIYFEYLEVAKQEVVSKIKETQKLKAEIENIILLSEKTEEFLEETNFDNDIVGYSSVSKNQNEVSASDEKYFNGDLDLRVGNNIVTQSISFSEILNQVKLSSLDKSQTYILNNLTSYTKINIYDFKKLIDGVEKQLVEYNAVLKSKLKK